MKEYMQSDNDFTRFRQLHKAIEPAKVWKMTKTVGLQLSDYVARMWVTVPLHETKVCSSCERSYTDPARHIVADCSVNLALRDEFMNSIIDTFPIGLHLELFTAGSERFLLLLLGAETNIELTETETIYFQTLCFNFIRNSARNYFE